MLRRLLALPTLFLDSDRKRLAGAMTLAVAALVVAACSLARYGPDLLPAREHARAPVNPSESFSIDLMTAPRVQPQFVPASEAELSDSEQLIDVEINGYHRAYPIALLEGPFASHVVNDSLGGVPIAVTWCDLSQTGVVFAREQEGETITLGVAGARRGNLVLYTPTMSYRWQQQTGEATDLKSAPLQIIASRIIDGAEWQQSDTGGEIYVGDASAASPGAAAGSMPLMTGGESPAASAGDMPAGLIKMQGSMMDRTQAMGASMRRGGEPPGSPPPSAAEAAPEPGSAGPSAD